uniref:Pancreatic trypsin inhibitor n=1 Tax=Rhipicephalus appendiculatus TaxID=34631 RepID=A0A131Z4Q1_RHIAP
MMATQTLTLILLSSILLLQEAHSLKDVEERRDHLDCDRRFPLLCTYPEACQCHPRAPLGRWSRLHYRYENGRCLRGGFVGNCNGFFSDVACQAACIRAWGPRG